MLNPPGEQQPSSERHLFICNAANVGCSLAWNEKLLPFCELFVLLICNFEYTNTPRESIVASRDCRLVHPTA